MIATLATLMLACAPYRPPMHVVPTTSACEGADRVTRNHDGIEISRAYQACSSVRCEGDDWVRRDLFGRELARQNVVRQCLRVRLSSDPSTPLGAGPAWRYGLSVRG